MQYLTTHYSPQGVRVNLLSLSTLQHSGNASAYQGSPLLRGVCDTLIPARCPVHVEELVSTLHFLQRMHGASITGQEITIDGGLSILSQVACAALYREDNQEDRQNDSRESQGGQPQPTGETTTSC